MSLKLYGYWRSSATYRVRIALNLKQLEYDYVPVHLAKDGGEQHQSDYEGLNPSHLVPTFVDDDEDIILNQSLAIIEYLDERYPDTCPLIPPHETARARVRALSYDLAADVQPIQNLRVLNRLSEQFDADTDARNVWCRHWIKKGLAAVEKRLQNTAGDYCFGFDLSMADLVLVPQVYNARRFAIDLADFPLIARVDANCSELDAFVAAAPENQIDAT